MWKESLLAAALALGGAAPPAAAAVAVRGALATVAAQPSTVADLAGFDGVVEAVRQTVVAAQVAGAVVALEVKAGDAVKAGRRAGAATRSAADRPRLEGGRAQGTLDLCLCRQLAFGMRVPSAASNAP